MDQLVSRLLLYGELEEESILRRLAELFQAWKEGEYPRQELIRGLYRQVKRLLDLATDYGFDENLWQNYLTFLLMTNENSFSLITERAGEQVALSTTLPRRTLPYSAPCSTTTLRPWNRT